MYAVILELVHDALRLFVLFSIGFAASKAARSFLQWRKDARQAAGKPK